MWLLGSVHEIYSGSPYRVLPAALKKLWGQAKIDRDSIPSARIGLFLSYSTANLFYLAPFLSFFEKHKLRFGCPNSFPFTPTNSLASHLAIEGKIEGPVMMLYEERFCLRSLRWSLDSLAQNRIDFAVFGWEGYQGGYAEMKSWITYAKGGAALSPPEKRSFMLGIVSTDEFINEYQ
ncbi:MAG: hypothetical protein GY710_23255 [Desulfobacteraceae bacterium]|nr:hypothetical protein [Desulfobacteraceae bacterium]